MPRSHAPYPPEFRRQMVELVKAGPIYMSEDGGGAWRSVLHVDGHDECVSGVTMAPSDPSTLLSLGQPKYVSTENSDLWYLTAAVFSPRNSRVVYGAAYAASYLGDVTGIRYSGNGGRTWQHSRVAPNGETFSVRQLTVGPDGRRLYLATSRGLHHAGENLVWTAVPGGLPAGVDTRAIALDPRLPSTLIVGTASGQLWRSADDGASWTKLVQPARDGQPITAILVHPEVTGGLFVGTQGAGVLFSSDGGASWTTVGEGLASTVIIDLAVDVSSSRLYAGTGDAGLFVTALPDSIGQTAVASAPSTRPVRLAIDKAYPNPFNATSRIEFSIPEKGPVVLEVCNVLGQRVITLVDDALTEGPHVAEWAGTDEAGHTVGSGACFLHLRTLLSKTRSEKGG